MIRKVTVEALECVCEAAGCPRNGLPWISLCQTPPKACSTCKSREWNGVKPRYKPQAKPKIELPKPKKVKWVEEETDL